MRTVIKWMVVLGLAVAASGCKPKAPPPAPVEEAKLKVEVQSVPAGAEVFVDDQRVEGLTPVTVVVPRPGESQLRLQRAGHEPWSGPLRLTGLGEPLVIQLTALLPVRVESEPAGAKVGCDGKQVLAATPGTFDIQAGRHKLTANLEGYLEAVEDRAFNDEQRSWKVTLTKAAFVDVTSNPPGARVFIDGTDTGRDTPAQRLAVSPGVHEVQAKHGKASSVKTKVKAFVGGKKVAVSLKVVDRDAVERDKKSARLAKLRSTKDKLEQKLDAHREGVIVKDANVLVKLEKQIEELQYQIDSLARELDE